METSRFNVFDNPPEAESQFDQIAKLGKDLSTSALELCSLYQIAAILSHKIDLEAALNILGRLFENDFQIDHYSLFLVESQTRELILKSSLGANGGKHFKKTAALNEDIFGEALNAGRPVLLNDLNRTNGACRLLNGLREKRGSLLCLPLISATTEEPLGVINLYKSETNAFPPSDLQMFTRLADQIARVLDQIIIYQQICELSFTDELTQIYNRRYFNQRFEREMLRAQRYQRPLSLLMIDIDHFKSFNDAHGHLAGDEVLKSVAKTLEKSLRKADIIARFGGEEFVILLPEINQKKALGVAEKLCKAVEGIEFDLAYSQPLGKITVSLGLASFPEIASRGNDLLQRADAALYQAKANGRNRVLAANSPQEQIQQTAEIDFPFVNAPLSPA